MNDPTCPFLEKVAVLRDPDRRAPSTNFTLLSGHGSLDRACRASRSSESEADFPWPGLNSGPDLRA